MGDMMQTNLRGTVQDFHSMMRTDLHLSHWKIPFRPHIREHCIFHIALLYCYVVGRKVESSTVNSGGQL